MNESEALAKLINLTDILANRVNNIDKRLKKLEVQLK